MTDITTLICVIAIATGYIAFSVGYYTRFRMLTISWEQRLFESAMIGGLFFAISRILIVWIIDCFPQVAKFAIVLLYKEALPFSFSISVLPMFLFAFISGFLVNKIISKEDAIIKVNEESGNIIRMQLVQAFFDECNVKITLNNGKIFVGLVTILPTFVQGYNFFTLLLLLEGEEKDGKTEFNRNYLKFKSDNSLKEFLKITIKFEDVTTVSRFSADIYSEFNKDDSKI